MHEIPGFHVAPSAKPGKFVTCHVATCLSEVPPGKRYVGALGPVRHENGTRQEHQMSAVGKWMSQASQTRGHVAHVLLHVRPQGVIFVLNVTNT